MRQKLREQIDKLLRRITGAQKALRRVEHRYRVNAEKAAREHKAQKSAESLAKRYRRHPRLQHEEERRAARCKYRAIKAHQRAEYFAGRILFYEHELGIDKKKLAIKEKHLKELEQHGGPQRMYDSVTVSEIPKHAEAVAGYTDGAYQTINSLRVGWPNAHILPINVFPYDTDGDCLDCEPGDASVEDAPGWYHRRKQHRARAPIPKPYTSVSSIDALVDAMEAAGIDRKRYKLWSAHYGHGPHVCGPKTCGETQHECDGTQYDDRALGRNLDVSMLKPGFF